MDILIDGYDIPEILAVPVARNRLSNIATEDLRARFGEKILVFGVDTDGVRCVKSSLEILNFPLIRRTVLEKDLDSLQKLGLPPGRIAKMANSEGNLLVSAPMINIRSIELIVDMIKREKRTVKDCLAQVKVFLKLKYYQKVAELVNNLLRFFKEKAKLHVSTTMKIIGKQKCCHAQQRFLKNNWLFRFLAEYNEGSCSVQTLNERITSMGKIRYEKIPPLPDTLSRKSLEYSRELILLLMAAVRDGGNKFRDGENIVKKLVVAVITSPLFAKVSSDDSTMSAILDIAGTMSGERDDLLHVRYHGSNHYTECGRYFVAKPTSHGMDPTSLLQPVQFEEMRYITSFDDLSSPAHAPSVNHPFILKYEDAIRGFNVVGSVGEHAVQTVVKASVIAYSAGFRRASSGQLMFHEKETAAKRLDQFVGGFLNELDLSKSFITGSSILASLFSLPSECKVLTHQTFLKMWFPTFHTVPVLLDGETVIDESNLHLVTSIYDANFVPDTIFHGDEGLSPSINFRLSSESTFGPNEDDSGPVTDESFLSDISLTMELKVDDVVRRVKYRVEEGTDLDIGVIADSQEEFDGIARKHYEVVKRFFPSTVLVRRGTGANRSWRIVETLTSRMAEFRSVEIFRMKYPCQWVTHHVPFVRGCFTSYFGRGNEFWVSASLVSAINKDIAIGDFRYFPGKKNKALDIVLKYIHRLQINIYPEVLEFFNIDSQEYFSPPRFLPYFVSRWNNIMSVSAFIEEVNEVRRISRLDNGRALKGGDIMIHDEGTGVHYFMLSRVRSRFIAKLSVFNDGLEREIGISLDVERLDEEKDSSMISTFAEGGKVTIGKEVRHRIIDIFSEHTIIFDEKKCLEEFMERLRDCANG